jgi:hypothetical protein
MAFENLSAKEQEIALRCMRATAVYLDDSEKSSRLGMEADELNLVMEQWPNIDDHEEGGIGFLAINNCMNEVCNGFRIADEDWRNWFDVPLADVRHTYRKWLEIRGTVGGIH